MSNVNPKNERTVLFGTVIEETEDKVKMSWLDSQTQDMREGFVRQETIAERTTLSDGTTALFLKDAKVGTVNIPVASTYRCEYDGAEQQDAADLWIEQAIVHKADPPADDDDLPTDDDLPMDDDLPTQDDMPFDEDYDDSVPVATTNAAGMNIEVGVQDNDTVELDDATAEKKEKKKRETAAQKAAKARAELYAQPDSEIVQSMNTDIGKALVGGKRHTDFAAWNFSALALPQVVMVQDPTNPNDIRYVSFTNNGTPVNRILLNPNERNPDASPDTIEHYGAVINPRLGQTYQHLDHKDWMIPFAEAVDDIPGVTYDRYCINKGARGAMTIDITDMATKHRKEAASNLTGYLNLDANSVNSILAEENGGHRCGVTLLNPLDGKGAFSAHMTVMRTYCGNMAMRGANQLMFKIRHTAGAIAAFDIEATAASLRSAFQEAQRHLLAAHLMKWIPVEGNFFDKMLTIFETHKLISKPTVAIDVHDYDKLVLAREKGTAISKEQMEQMMRIGRGHAYKAVLHGYTNPDVDYVNLQENDPAHTANHLMQCITGMLSNQPVIVDDQMAKGGKTVQRVLTGAKQTGMEGFMKKTTKATDLFEKMVEANVKVYCKAIGQDVLTTDDLPKMKQWFIDNPHKIVAPKGKSMNATQTLADVPEFHDTWAYNDNGSNRLKILTADMKL